MSRLPAYFSRPRYERTGTLVHGLTSLHRFAGELSRTPVGSASLTSHQPLFRLRRIVEACIGGAAHVTAEDVERVVNRRPLPPERFFLRALIPRVSSLLDAARHWGEQGQRSTPATYQTLRAFLQADPSAPSVSLALPLPASQPGVLPPDARLVQFYEFLDHDDLLGGEHVLRAAALGYGLQEEVPATREDMPAIYATVLQELTAGGFDPHAILLLRRAEDPRHDPLLLRLVAFHNLTFWFETFCELLHGCLQASRERLEQISLAPSPLQPAALDPLEESILAALSRLGHASTPELLAALPPPAPGERTVQRRLSSLLGRSLILKEGTRRNARYRPGLLR
jgi:hypothetical protein